jgi:hypothetical protein
MYEKIICRIKVQSHHFIAKKGTKLESIARVFRRDSPPTQTRRSTGGGGESSSRLIRVEGDAVQGGMLL